MILGTGDANPELVRYVKNIQAPHKTNAYTVIKVLDASDGCSSEVGRDEREHNQNVKRIRKTEGGGSVWVGLFPWRATILRRTITRV